MRIERGNLTAQCTFELNRDYLERAMNNNKKSMEKERLILVLHPMGET